VAGEEEDIKIKEAMIMKNQAHIIEYVK